MSRAIYGFSASPCPVSFPRSTYLLMAMTLRSVVALALVAFAVTEDMPQDAAPALEALPQSFWDNFVYCKCGLSCAEKDGSIGKACHDVDPA